MSDIYMRILMSAQSGNVMAVMNQVGRSVGSVASALGNGSSLGLSGSLIGVAAAVGVAATALAVGIGIKAVKASGDFQQAMLSNVAHAGLARSEFGKVSQSVLQMATDVGRSPIQLAEAMYPILSAFSGITNQSAKSALALDTLKLSFQAVAGTTVNGTDVANAAVGTFNALGLATNNATLNASRMKTLFDQMDLTVQLGNMQWDAYKNVISKLAVSIQGTGISFNEASAALATMTNMGFSAQRAQTYLSNTFTTMAIKTNAMAAHAKKLKISFDEQAYSSMNLAQKIAYLNQITDGNKQKILALLGNNATALKTFNALSTGIKGYQSNVQALNHSQGALKASFDTASQGFNFQMSRIKAAGEVLLITIGNQLLPTVTQLARAVVPIIAGFSKWLISSGALQGAVALLVGGLTNLITTGSNLYNFFSKNHTALVLLQLGLVALAGGIIGAMVPALIVGTAGLWSMAVAAWAAMVPLLPFIAIGALVALAIVGIVLAVKNWGAIAHWLQGVWNVVLSWLRGVWSGFSSWFMGALHAIGAFFVGIWNGIVNGVKAAWNWIVNTAKAGAALVLAVITSPFHQIANLFIWLYNHNYYFQLLVDKIKSIVTIGLLIVQSLWSKAVQWIVDQFNLLKEAATLVWALIQFIIQQKVQQTSDQLHSLWSNITSWLQSQWNRFSGFAQNAWSQVGSVFSSAWSNNISGPLNSMAGQVNSWFSNLAGQMVQFGENLINSLAQGIRNAAGAVGSAVAGVAGQIHDFLGFHSPTRRGPGSTAHLWMPALVTMMSNDLKNGGPKAMAAAEKLMSQIESAIKSKRIQIAQADLGGNRSLARFLRQQKADMEMQLRAYRDLLTIHGDTYSAVTGLITSSGHTRGLHRGTRGGGSSSSGTPGYIVWFQQALNQIIRLLGGNPMSVSAGGSGGSYGGSSSGGSSGVPNYGPGSIKFIPEPSGRRHGHPVIVHHHHYNINTMARSQSEVRNLLDMIEQEQSRRFRTQTPGYASGGVF